MSGKLSHNNERIPIMKFINYNTDLMTFTQIAEEPSTTPHFMRHKERGTVMPDRQHLIPIHY